MSEIIVLNSGNLHEVKDIARTLLARDSRAWQHGHVDRDLFLLAAFTQWMNKKGIETSIKVETRDVS